jgi:F-type H+-transporting ATPase subunit epsilon
VRLKILLPAGVLLEEEVVKVIAEAVNGSFCLLPKHIDFVTALAPGLFAYESVAGGCELIALDAGTLVKRGADVLVAVRHAVRSPERGELHRAIREQLAVLDEKERRSRTATAHLETDIVRRFLALRKEE